MFGLKLSNIGIGYSHLFLTYYYNILCNRRGLSLNIICIVKCISPLLK